MYTVLVAVVARIVAAGVLRSLVQVLNHENADSEPAGCKCSDPDGTAR